MSINTAYAGNVNAIDLITLRQINPTGPAFRCHLIGDDEPSGGNARWDTLERPGRTSTIEYTGADLHTLTLPLRLDGFSVLAGGTDATVEPQCAQLQTWRRPTPGASQPPALTLDGPLRQPPYRPWWVITDLEWGEQVRGDGPLAGQRIMQEVRVTFLEHLQGEVLRGVTAQALAKAGLR